MEMDDMLFTKKKGYGANVRLSVNAKFPAADVAGREDELRRRYSWGVLLFRVKFN
jgi:hypothetical protein